MQRLEVSGAVQRKRVKPKRIPVRAFYLNEICCDTLGNFQTLVYVPLHNTKFSVLR